MLLPTLILTLIVAPNVRAQSQTSDINFSLSPAILELVADPGDIFTSSLSFVNQSSHPTAGHLSANSFIPIDTIVDQTKRSQFDASSWISIKNPDQIFAPSTEHSVDFTVSVPPQAEAGSHYTLITLKPGVVADDNNSTTVLPEISASIFITVTGSLNEKAELISDFDQISRVYRNKSTKLSFRIRNTGNVHILPSPKISILKNNKRIKVFNMTPQLILPNTEKTFSINWNDVGVNFGSYTMQAELTYGSENIPLASSPHKFLVLPSLFYMFLVLTSSILGIILLIKRRNIPRMIAVLKGNANFSSGKFKRNPGPEDLPHKAKAASPITEVIVAFEHPSDILGLEDSQRSERRSNEESKPRKTIKQKRVRPKIISTSLNNDASKTTFITQTESSTIVREAPSTPQLSKPKTIKVRDAEKTKSSVIGSNKEDKKTIKHTSKKSARLKKDTPQKDSEKTKPKKVKKQTSRKTKPTNKKVSAAKTSTTGDKSKPKNLNK